MQSPREAINALLMSIIEQAFEDLGVKRTGAGRRKIGGSSYGDVDAGRAKRIRRAADAARFVESEEFALVCNLLGANPERFRKPAAAQIERIKRLSVQYLQGEMK